MVVLEREDRARARGATIYASIDGYGSTCDAYHRVQMAPDGEEIVRAIDAGDRRGRDARREEIGYVNYHGTSTHAERRGRVAVRAPGVRRATPIALAGSSTKSMIGHPQGASGAAGVVTAALAMSRGFLPPTINHRRSRSGVRPRLHPEPGPRRADVEAALCNCLGFGSKNSALVIGRVA